MAKLVTFRNGAKNSSAFLTSEAGEEAIRKYFLAILRLSNSGEAFPVDLDDVWALCYDTKGNAVRELKNRFIEGVDYVHFIKDDKMGSGGRATEGYLVSVSCVEFLIARKVRIVFEVYRRVFHRSVSEFVKESSLDELTKSKIMFVECAARMLNMNEVSKLQMLQDNFAYLGPVLPEYVKAEDATMSATDLLRKHDIHISASEFNKKLSAAGYIERLERTSTSGKNGKKSFWKVTDKGKEFGENEVSPHNPKETQPRWFVDKFPELLKSLDII